MLSYIFGGYGGGKSYLGTKKVLQELLTGTRPVITNLALDLKEMNHYLQTEHPRASVRLHQRLRILTDEEVKHFFAFRISRNGWHYELPLPSDEAEKRGARPDLTRFRDDGCLYVIDEVHEYFNARAWMEVGRSVSWYKNQHRKFGDDIIFITPLIAEVEKSLRNSGGLYIQTVNLGQRKIKGVVLPQSFIVREFSTIPDKHTPPLNSAILTMDLKIAKCYDTRRGVKGVQGTVADLGKRPKGIPLWVMTLVFFLTVLVIVWGCFYLGHRIKKYAHSIKSLNPITAYQHTNALSPAGSVSVPATKSRQRQPRNGADESGEPVKRMVELGSSPDETNDIYCTGYVILDNSPICYFSDGSMACASDGDVQKVEKHWVYCWHRKYRICVGRSVSAVPPPVAPATPAVTQSPLVYTISAESPVNDAEILPAIHSLGQGLPPPGLLGGFSHTQQPVQNRPGQPPANFNGQNLPP